MAVAGPFVEDDHRLLHLAVSQGMLTQDDVKTLLDDATDSACDLAIRRHLVTAAQLDLLRPLANPQEFLSGYEFLGLIGEGAAGIVYCARQRRLNRTVALKLLKHSALENQTATARSQMEARLGASMQHPNIATVYDYGVQNGRIYLAMELVNGRSLLELIESDEPVSEPVALHIIRQVVDALSHAADNHIVHRDIKPANLLLTDHNPGLNLPPDVPAVKVLDFGLAFQSTDIEATRLTADGAALGTPCYVAPEQLRSSHVDLRADIYALGATLFHLITREQPFGSSNAFQAMAAKMQADENWREQIPDDVSIPVRQLILDMTHYAADDRFQSYQTLSARIDEILHDESLSQRRRRFRLLSRRHPLRRWARSRIVWMVLLTVVATAVWFANRQTPLTQRDVRVVEERYLFEGFETPTRRLRGAWRPGTDSERAPVLAGAYGWIRFDESPRNEAPLPTFYQFQVGINPLGQAAADVCFATQSSGECSIVRIRDGVATFGRGQCESSDFRIVKDLSPINLLSRTDGPGYHLVTVDHQTDGWFVTVDGHPLATLPTTAEDRPEMVLRAINGTVHFEGVRYAETQIDDAVLATHP